MKHSPSKLQAHTSSESEEVALKNLEKRLAMIETPSRSRLAHAQTWALLEDRISGSRPKRTLFGWRTVAFPAILTISLLVITLGSQNSLPGDFTYGIKRGVENTQVALALTTTKKADACSMQMKRRANELARLPGDKLSATTVQQLSRSITTEADEFSEYIKQSGSDKARLTDQRQRDIAYTVDALRSTQQHTQDPQNKNTLQATIDLLETNG